MKLPFVLASRFVAAETLEETLPVVEALNRKGLRVALDRLGEYVDERALAIETKEIYLDTLRTVAEQRDRHDLDIDLSIKLSSIGQTVDHTLCRDQLLELLSVAQTLDFFVTLDMEGSDLTQSTLDLFKQAYQKYPDHVGIVLQAYLKRTANDVEEICDLGARVRLCKGAYDEPPEIAYQQMEVIREKYTTYMKRLISGARYPGIATHDDTLITTAKKFVAENDISRDALEFQMLYGIRPTTQERLVREGYNCLVYVPYGSEWLPYFSRRLRERKENVWFVLKNLFRR